MTAWKMSCTFEPPLSICYMTKETDGLYKKGKARGEGRGFGGQAKGSALKGPVKRPFLACTR